MQVLLIQDKASTSSIQGLVHIIAPLLPYCSNKPETWASGKIGTMPSFDGDGKISVS